MEITQERKVGWLKLILIVVSVAVVTSALTMILMMRYLFPKEFEPVKLSIQEENVLKAKVNQLQDAQFTQRPDQELNAKIKRNQEEKSTPLVPERYSEKGAKRTVSFTERELNALIAQNTDLAPKLAVDLSDNLASAKLLVPLDPTLPFVGGKTLKVTAGLELRYENQRPVIALKGISLWGVPIPNAWLGGLKNVDLVKEFGSQGGFWQIFSEGIEYIRVEDGQLTIKLKK
jgi:hypothetical protein